MVLLTYKNYYNNYFSHFTALWTMSGTTWVSQYQKGETNLDLLEQEIVSGSGIMCKSAHRPRQITTLAPHHSVFYWPDALPATQTTASKQHTHTHNHISSTYIHYKNTVKQHHGQPLVIATTERLDSYANLTCHYHSHYTLQNVPQ